MRQHFGYFEEEELGKAYDKEILKRLYPFIQPYRGLLVGAILLIILMTFIDISVPYITKIAIDRYIVPSIQIQEAQVDKNSKIRYLSFDMKDTDIASVVRKYSDQFKIENDKAFIPFEELSTLEKKDIARLRKNDLWGVTLAALIFIFLILISFSLNFLQVMMTAAASQKIMHDMRIKVFSHIQTLSISFFTRNSVGRLVTRATNDVQNMNEVFGSIIIFVFKDIFLIIGVTIVLLHLNWKLALVAFTTLPLLLYASLHFSGHSREVFRILRVKVADINSRFSETISGIRIIQLFKQEIKNYRDFKNLNREHYQAGVRQVQIVAAFLRFMGFLDIFVIAIVVFYGGSRVLAGTISLGEFVAFLAYMKMFFSPIQDVAQKYNIMQNAMASAERIFLILDSKEKLPEVSNSSIFNPHASIKDIEMENVSFAYMEDEMVLKDISFKVKAGETIAFVGQTGSGKTSLIHLIIRFYDPSTGQVLINGQDIKNANFTALRSKMSLVTQDPFLFSGSIRENIFQEDSSHSAQEIERILSDSNCKDLINKLPKGLDTELSEGGASISSGERQLISIARAFARNPDLIILDEATSYIDSETEAKIQKALDNLMYNRTSIIVAHRLSTVRHADKIIVLHKGRIIEYGTHEALMDKKGFYFKLNLLNEK